MTALQRDKAGLTAGLRVAVHAHAAAAIDLAVAIGVETLEHATYVTPGRHPVGDSISASLSQQATYEQLDALAASGAHVCPTLGGFTPELFEDAPPVLKQRLAESGMTPEEVVGRRRLLLGRMHDAGVRFVGGSDAGIAPLKAHGRYPAAVVELAAVFGVVPSLVASTSTAAEVCGLGTATGSLRRGYDADLLVVDGDLATDLDLLWQVRQVVLRGRATPSPVQRDLEAGGT
jgi:imidazolonepropionase-like amidohydrolase